MVCSQLSLLFSFPCIIPFLLYSFPLYYGDKGSRLVRSVGKFLRGFKALHYSSGMWHGAAWIFYIPSRFYPKNTGSRFPRNASTHLPNYKASRLICCQNMTSHVRSKTLFVSEFWVSCGVTIDIMVHFMFQRMYFIPLLPPTPPPPQHRFQCASGEHLQTWDQQYRDVSFAARIRTWQHQTDT